MNLRRICRVDRSCDLDGSNRTIETVDLLWNVISIRIRSAEDGRTPYWAVSVKKPKWLRRDLCDWYWTWTIYEAK